MSIRNKLFAKYGHDCTIPSGLEDLPMFKPSANIFTQIKNILIRFRMASELNYRCQTFLKSQKNLNSEHRRHVKYIYTIHPFSEFRKYWEMFMVIVLAVQFIMIPLDVCFYKMHMLDNCTSKSGWRLLRALVDAICIIDIIISFFTGYCDQKKNIIVLKPRDICIHYLMTYFLPDFLSTIPAGYGIEFQSISHVLLILSYLAPLKLFRIPSFLKYCRQFCQTFQVGYSTYKISMLFFLYVLYWHIICCVTIFITVRSVPVEFHTSMYNETREQMPYNVLFSVHTTYFYLFYETARLINNSGHLRISNQESYKYYTICVWIFSRIFYMYLTSLVVDAMLSRTSAMQKYYEVVGELKDYMSHHKLPAHLRARLIDYYDFRFQRTYFRESEILNNISGHLRQEVVMHKCRRLVERVDFFKGLPLTLLLRIVSVLHQEFYMTNDVVIKIGAYGDCMYFIGSGTVAVFAKAGTEVCHLIDGDHFGEIALVAPQECRTAAVIAVETSELYRLDRSDFMRAIMPYPDLLMKIESIACARQQETHELAVRG